MRISYELDFASFEPWSGAVDTHRKIIEAEKAELFESMLEDCYPDGMSETELNDLLWFEPEWCLQLVGIRTESEIREELEAAKIELEDIETAYEDACEDLREEYADISEAEHACIDMWADEYEADANEIQARINDLEEELENY